MRKIGTEQESNLHRTLKFRYCGTIERTEQLIGNYICDGISDSGEIIEVQTGNFGPLKDKIPFLTQQYRVRLIHPIIIHKKIEVYNPQGVLLWQRKSPRKGTAWDLFKYLLYAPMLPLTPGLTIELVLVDMIEERIQDGKGSWRRRGVSIWDKKLDQYHRSIPLKEISDYYQFVPFQSRDEFTTQGLSKKAGIPVSVAQKTLYVLTMLKVVERLRKSGRAWIYRFSPINKGKKNKGE